ncbi:fluoride efflux transporter CrcB [Endozoicomonas sp. SCSIO W0465]|uniref:fluoride efflux transporter CrcB n=1 Tax=Endozoicomonas sp. SCSIO W0465 TaxID=2918516 RepID=UPI0020752B09|nr:fluoride efflux transporter CrcB [Endozoicomonas sp. SCSIO W0465]USE33809.1 fluoride efflux transporter CrcB [Endozoicomonas sp. SCSIO W0465]
MKYPYMLNYLSVAAGGALGALARSLIYEWYAKSGNEQLFPLPTITVNIIGSLLIGITWYCLAEKSLLPPVWRDFTTVGFLGALTTFSTFSLDVFRLFQSDRLVEAIAYVLVSVILCLVGTWLGYQGIRVILNG